MRSKYPVTLVIFNIFYVTLCCGENALGNLPALSSTHTKVDGYPQTQNPSQESAKLERTFKELRAYDAFQSALINYLKPTPIVDGIREEEKYGNDGDRLGGLGKVIVGGTETVSKVINKAFAVPQQLLQKVSSKTTQVLNQVGGAIIGL